MGLLGGGWLEVLARKIDPDKVEAAKGVALHLRRFWDPRMRRQIVAHYRDGGAGLRDVARAAIGLLADES